MTRKNGTVVLDLNVERKADSDDDDEVSDIVDMYESPKERGTDYCSENTSHWKRACVYPMIQVIHVYFYSWYSCACSEIYGANDTHKEERFKQLLFEGAKNP
jgi:hypothetical protein